MLLVSRGLKSQIYAHVSQLYKQFTKEVVESNKLAWAFPPRQLTDSAEANADAIVPFCVLVCVSKTMQLQLRPFCVGIATRCCDHLAWHQ